MNPFELKASYCGVDFLIEEDIPGITYYLYVFMPDGETYDDLQNSVLVCKLFANEEYGLPMDYWSDTNESDKNNDFNE